MNINLNGKFKNELNLNFCKKINKNMYFFIYFLFKYSLLKDFISSNYKVLLNINQINLYNNIKECRFYFLFYYFLLNNSFYEIIKNLFNNAKAKDKKSNININKLEWWQEENINKDFFINNKNLYFFNKLIFILIIMLVFNFKWILYFSKYKYYKNKYLLSKIFFFNEFIVKIDYNNFFLYRKYLNYFKIVKYNEYILNNRVLYHFPKLKYLLRYSINKLELDRVYRKNIMLFSFFIYKVEDKVNEFSYKYSDIFLNKISNFIDLHVDYNIINKWINQYSEKNALYLMRGLACDKGFKLNLYNEYIYLKFKNSNILKFLNFFNPFIYYNFLEIFKLLLSVYIAYISYEVYHKYILLDKKLRRFKCKHIKSLHWKYNSLKFKFIDFFYKIIYQYNTYYHFNNDSILNYGFLSFYYLENNKFICNFIKKNILLYRILNLVIIKWSYLLFDYVHWDLNKNAHTFKNLSNPDVQKAWKFNYIKRIKYNELIAPLLYVNYYNKKVNFFLKSKLTSDFNISKDVNKINFIFNFLWNIFYKLSFVKYIKIINNNKLYINKILLKYKYSLEFIFWEIINSNNKYYLNYKYFLGFNKIISVIKINNIISVYLTKYYNFVSFYLVTYNKDYFINICILYLFFYDFFFRIFFKKNNYKYIKKIIINNLSLFYKIRLSYNNYFFWQINNYLCKNRFKIYFDKNKLNFYEEYKFIFSLDYVKELQSVIKDFKVIKE